jgi:hypothetical protein
MQFTYPERKSHLIRGVSDTQEKKYPVAPVTITPPREKTDTIHLHRPHTLVQKPDNIVLPVKNIPARQIKSLHVNGNCHSLPWYDKTPIKRPASVSFGSADRLVFINPSNGLIEKVENTYLDKGKEVIAIYLKFPTRHFDSRTHVFVVKRLTPIGMAGFTPYRSSTLVTGSLAATLLYLTVFHPERSIGLIHSNSLGYMEPVSVHKKAVPSANYIAARSVELAIKDGFCLSDTIQSIGSTMICACHFSSLADMAASVARLRRMASSLGHRTMIYVYSCASGDYHSFEEVIRKNKVGNEHFLSDKSNIAGDAGKYLIGLRSMTDMSVVFKDEGFLTLTNDSVLCHRDLSAFAAAHSEAVKNNSFVGAVSSNEAGFHYQSWFLTFNGLPPIKKYMDQLSHIVIDDDEPRKSIINGMELGICHAMRVCFSSTAIYPGHEVTANNPLDWDEWGLLIGNALKICGMPFIKRRMLRTLEEENRIDQLHVELSEYS